MQDLPARSSTSAGQGLSETAIEPSTPVAAILGRRPAILDAPPNVAALLGSLKRRWLLAAVVGVFGAACSAVAVYHVMPPARHVAKAMLHVASTQPSIIFPTQEVRSTFEIYKQTQLRLLKGRSVLAAVLRDPKVKDLNLFKQAANQSEPISWLEKEIQAEYTGEVLNISMSGDGPEGLAAIVNAVAQSYLVEVVNAEVKERRNRFEELQGIYRQQSDRLQSKRKELEALAAKLGSGDQANVRQMHAMALGSRTMMERQLLQYRLDLRESEIQLSVLREAEKPVVEGESFSAEAVEQAVRGDEVVLDLEARIRRLSAAVASASRLARQANDPSVRRPQEDMKHLTRQLRERESAVRQVRSRELKAIGPVGPNGSLAGLENRIKVLKETMKLAEADLKGLSSEAGAINVSSMELEKLQNEIALQEEAHKLVGKEVESLNVELKAPSRVRLIEPADNPSLSGDKRLKLAALTGVATLALVVGGITYSDFLTRRVRSTDDVVLGLGLRLIGTLPPLPRRQRTSRPRSTAPPLWHAELIESVDNLRTNFLNSASGRSIRSLVVTSAVSGEGKTSLACHLATSIARAGRKTLLIDGDLRCSEIHGIFDLPTCPGLSEVIRCEADVSASIHASAFPDLWVLTAGLCDEQALRALAQDKLRDLLGQLKRDFDFIVIDTPPVLPVADAALIAEQADAYIHAVLGEVSQLPQVFTAHERLQSLGIPTFGVVVAGVRGINYGGKINYHQGRLGSAPRAEAG
jgi:succinoglycan biosynthesis transport protein ExoP